MSSEKETKGISAAVVLDIIGKPPEHLVETLEDMIKKIDSEKGIKVVSKKINEPVLMKNQKEFYTTFAEVEVEVDEIFDIAILLFKYMPAHVEIIHPEMIVLTNNGWNEILNEIVRRLHGYDEVARMTMAEKSILEKKLRSLMGEKKENKK